MAPSIGIYPFQLPIFPTLSWCSALSRLFHFTFSRVFNSQMASTISMRPRLSLATTNISGLKLFSFINPGRNSLSFRSPRFRISSSAKPDTVGKVCEIVRKQLAVSDDKLLTGESKLSELGADSLDTVEIVMGLEEEFGITVGEDNAQNITTVQDAADLIDELCSNKAT